MESVLGRVRDPAGRDTDRPREREQSDVPEGETAVDEQVPLREREEREPADEPPQGRGPRPSPRVAGAPGGSAAPPTESSAIYSTTATASISTPTPFGSAPACTADRAGGDSSK